VPSAVSTAGQTNKRLEPIEIITITEYSYACTRIKYLTISVEIGEPDMAFSQQSRELALTGASKEDASERNNESTRRVLLNI